MSKLLTWRTLPPFRAPRTYYAVERVQSNPITSGVWYDRLNQIGVWGRRWNVWTDTQPSCPWATSLAGVPKRRRWRVAFPTHRVIVAAYG